MKKIIKNYPSKALKEYFFHEKKKLVLFDVFLFLVILVWSLFHRNTLFVLGTTLLLATFSFFTAWSKMNALKEGKDRSFGQLEPFVAPESYLILIVFSLLYCLHA